MCNKERWFLSNIHHIINFHDKNLESSPRLVGNSPWSECISEIWSLTHGFYQNDAKSRLPDQYLPRMIFKRNLHFHPFPGPCFHVLGGTWMELQYGNHFQRILESRTLFNLITLVWGSTNSTFFYKFFTWPDHPLGGTTTAILLRSQLRTLIALGHGEVIRPAAVIRFDRKWSVTTAIQRTTSIRKRALEEINPETVEGHLLWSWGRTVPVVKMVRSCWDM